MKHILSFLLAFLMIAITVCSCSGEKTGGGGAGDVSTDGDYAYPKLDFKGENVVVSNLEPYPGSHMYFVVDAENTSETLDAALWESNMRLEQQFNFTLVEDQFPLGDWGTRWIEHANHMIRNFVSGDDVYDFVFCNINRRPDLITSGYLSDLSEFDALQFDKPWWDAKFNEDVSIDGRLYMASGSANLMAYENMSCLMFNKEIIANNQLESPYELVREGKWTLDALFELASACKNMGSDPNFMVLAGEGGTSTYGIGIHRDYPPYFFTAAGVEFVTETDGNYDFTLGSTDDFYLALDKILPFFTHCDQGGVGGGDAGGSNNSIRKLFPEGRIAFCMDSVMNSFNVMRDSEIEFGFLPLPKLREEQEEYITSIEDFTAFLCIPAASTRANDTAALLDAMAYDRHKNVVPVFYDSFLTYKGVRDEDSLEMLQIMTDTRTMDIGMAYGWCYEVVSQKIGWNIIYGTAASQIAANEDVINETIDTFINEFFK